jgi:hypothetical protein
VYQGLGALAAASVQLQRYLNFYCTNQQEKSTVPLPVAAMCPAYSLAPGALWLRLEHLPSLAAVLPVFRDLPQRRWPGLRTPQGRPHLISCFMS